MTTTDTAPDIAGLPETVTLSVCGWNGKPRYCVYLNNNRIAGPKPWGGAHDQTDFTVKVSEVLDALSLSRSDQHTYLLKVISDIRFAVGDNGKAMLSELASAIAARIAERDAEIAALKAERDGAVNLLKNLNNDLRKAHDDMWGGFRHDEEGCRVNPDWSDDKSAPPCTCYSCNVVRFLDALPPAQQEDA